MEPGPDEPTLAPYPPARTVGRNTFINLAGGVVPILVSLITIPLYLRVIGEARYGVLTVIWLLLGYFGAFDLGLGRATTNQIAKVRGGSAREGEEIFWAAIAVNAALGVLGALCLFIAGHFFLSDALGLPVALRAEAVAVLPLVAAAVPFMTLSSVCAGALEGLERFGTVNVLQVIAIAVYQVAPLTVAYVHGPNLSWLVAAVAAAPPAGAILGFAACVRLLPLTSRPRIERSRIGVLLRYGGWITVTSLVGPLLTVTDRLVIGAVSGARAVTQYTVPMSLVSRLAIFPMSLARALFPRFSAFEAHEAWTIGEEAARGLAVVMTPIVVGSLVLLEPFLTIWVGAPLADVAAPVGAVILVGIWINSLAFVPYALLQGQGRPDLPAKFHLLELPPYLLGLWLGLSLAGIEGAAWVWTLRVAADAALLFVATGLYRTLKAEFASPAAIVALAYAAALTVFHVSLWRVLLGGSLVLLSLLWSWSSAPPPMRELTAAFWRARVVRRGLSG